MLFRSHGDTSSKIFIVKPQVRGRSVFADDGADLLALDRTDDVLRVLERKDEHGNVVVHRKRRGRGVHDRKVLGQHVLIGDSVVLDRICILGGVGVVNAVDVLGEQDHVGIDLRRAQHRCRVGREERRADAAAKEHYAALFQMTGADVSSVRRGIGADLRIGNRFLYPGCGYGGSCFPKDVKALVHTGKKAGYKMQVLEAVESVNERQKEVVFQKLSRYYKGDLNGKRIAMWGLAFKPETDDMREATSLVTIDLLKKAGCEIVVFDPVAMDECKRRIGDSVIYADDMYSALQRADALLLLTEWKQFRIPDWSRVKNEMANSLIVDGRNIYEIKDMMQWGFDYLSIGRTDKFYASSAKKI